MPAWLALNGINFGSIASASGAKGERRDIGDVSASSDGTTRATRVARKRDISFETVPLSGDDAFAVESLVSGEGHSWAFDTHLYSSKGLGPTSSTGASIQSGSAKYGAGRLRLASGSTEITYTPFRTDVPQWTVAFYRRDSGVGTWFHYVINSSGQKWVDGVRNDAASTSAFFAVVSAAGTIQFIGDASVSTDFDDVVATPSLWLTSWPAQVFAAGAAFGALPFHTVSGKLVKEAATRTMVGKCSESGIMVAGIFGRQNDVRKLNVELTEV